ncbi:hypothetical protein AB836_00585 [Rickettsiales bacterium (ex Bugula neritina AB1)]|nr:hypothetical protein AB836_00585 [Rickettsiales bacterium (ex Bugula neritina AB1)]
MVEIVKRTRYAPSPTGMMHIGNSRSCILSYLFSKANNGEFILRIDDTDAERSHESFEEQIYKDLKWLQISYHKKIKQSERKQIYEEYFNKLKDLKYIYACYEKEDELQETSIYNRKSYYLTPIEKQKLEENTKPHWRFFMKKDVYKMHDEVLGDIKIKRSWSDPIIKRTDGSFTYNFTSAVDDYLEKITDIIRSMEHLKNTFIQQEIIEAFNENYQIKFYHLPLIVDMKGEKLSKRKGNLSLITLKEEGIHYLSIFSFVTSLGTKNNPLITSNKNDFIDYLCLSSFSRSSPKFSKDILENINKKIIKQLSKEEIKLLGFNEKIWNITKDNLKNLKEYYEWKNILDNEVFFGEFQYIKELKNLYREYGIDFFLYIHESIKKDFLRNLRFFLTNKYFGPEIKKIFEYKLPLLKKNIL